MNIHFGKDTKPAVALLLIAGLLFGCKNSDNNAGDSNNTTPVAKETPVINFAVTNTFPHDTTLFTEGLLIHNGQMYESTGSPDDMDQTRSMIGMEDLKTGKFDKKVEIDRKKYFGEGIVFFKDKLYELTYKNQLGFIYDAKTFKPVGKFTYANAEGWSLTTNGNEIIMSDGTPNLTFFNPADMKPTRTLQVTEKGFPVQQINELEYIKGYIYANIWMTNTIIKIDPSNGKVVGKLDLTALDAEAKKKSVGAEVLNGIAYDSTTDKIFVTGKLWPTIYQIDFAH